MLTQGIFLCGKHSADDQAARQFFFSGDMFMHIEVLGNFGFVSFCLKAASDVMNFQGVNVTIVASKQYFTFLASVFRWAQMSISISKDSKQGD